MTVSHFQVMQQRAAIFWLLDVVLQVNSFWWPTLMYSLYLLPGPWCAGQFSSAQPVGLLFAHGALLFEGKDDGAFVPSTFIDTPEPTVVACIHVCCTVIPGTLWLATLASCWKERAQVSHFPC